MKLSVILPVCNGGDHLQRAIESVLVQDFGDFEFIIIDDASRDHSPEIIRHMAAQDLRIKAIIHAENAGVAATLNEGLHIASTPYVARMDHDDESLPNRLGVQYTFMRSRSEVAVAGSFVLHMGIVPERDKLVRLPVDAAEIKQSLPDRNCIYHPSVIMNRRMVLNAGGYRKQFRNAEDYDLWLRLSRDHDVVNIPVPLLRYRLAVGGQSLGRRWEQLYYGFLGLASFQNPDVLWTEVEQIAHDLHRATNKQDYLGQILTGTVKELLDLGRCDEARQLVESFRHDVDDEKVRQILGSLPSGINPGEKGKWLPSALSALAFWR